MIDANERAVEAMLFASDAPLDARVEFRALRHQPHLDGRITLKARAARAVHFAHWLAAQHPHFNRADDFRLVFR